MYYDLKPGDVVRLCRDVRALGWEQDGCKDRNGLVSQVKTTDAGTRILIQRYDVRITWVEDRGLYQYVGFEPSHGGEARYDFKGWFGFGTFKNFKPDGDFHFWCTKVERLLLRKAG